MLEYQVKAKRLNQHGSLAQCKQAEITLDTDLNGRDDAFNPAELLLGALSACMIKNIERVCPIIHFNLTGVAIRLTGYRQDSPPKMQRIDYEIIVDSHENQRKLDLLHTNIKKYGTVYNTLAIGCELTGTLRQRVGWVNAPGENAW